MELSKLILILLSQFLTQQINLSSAINGSSLNENASLVSSKVFCRDDEMQIEIESNGKNVDKVQAHIYGLKEYPDGSCQAERMSESHLRFRLSFKDFYRCGTTQILNKLTGTRTFYNRVVVEVGGSSEEFLVKCQHGNRYAAVLDTNHLNALLQNAAKNGSSNGLTERVKRDVLPAGFKEDPNLVPITEAIGKAPEPMLSMVVKKDGEPIGSKLVVQPGAPLTMEVSLDSVSKDIYGILLSQLDVTDTGTQSEILFHNACSVDTYLFENFQTLDGDVLSAKFKAFKFPDTNYVLFRGTINVCLNTCKGVQCSTGQLGYGKRKRRETGADFEVHATAIVQVADMGKDENESGVIGSTYPHKTRNIASAKQTQNGISVDVQADRSMSQYLAPSIFLTFALSLISFLRI